MLWALSHMPQRRLFIPMQPRNRSLNLSNAVAVVLFEAWRQWGFRGAARAGRRPAPATPKPGGGEHEPGR